MNTYSRIALIGSTGKAGSVILNALLKNNFNISLLVRNTSKLNHQESRKLKIITGDALDPDALYKVIDESDVIINAVSNTGNHKPISSKLSQLIIDRIGPNTEKQYFVITGKTVKASKDKISIKTIIERFMLKKT